MANDGGNLILTDKEKAELLALEPKAEKFIFSFVGSDEFINNTNRWCLWLQNALPSEIRTMPLIIEKIEGVKRHRLKSNRKATQKLADYPYLFGEIRQPNSDYLLIPRVSSENRAYIPLGFFSKETIANDRVAIIPNATLYLFGVLTSIMHNAWMRQVCGRLEGRYNYSNNLVYNNFPFPNEPSAKQFERVERTAQNILDARLNFPDATLADLYDSLLMPKVLLDAHRANNEAVDACYGKQRFKNELERLEYLFDLYRKYTQPLAVIEEKETRKVKRQKGK